MNKEITIYELLGLIKDGKAPEVIRYKQLIYCKEFDGYYTSNELKLKLSIMNNLNDKVEIIEDLYNLKIYMTSLQQKVEQLENIRKEAIKATKDVKQFVYDELVDRNVSGATETHCKIMDLLKILNKGSE